MSDWRTEMTEALGAFLTVAELAGAPIQQEELVADFGEAPHRPPSSLPEGKMAIYGFWAAGSWLKIGMAGPRSQARYTSQHYNPASAPSTLAASLARDPLIVGTSGFNVAAPGDWIKSSTHRVNILVPSGYGLPLLALLEAFLHVRLKPRYEK